MSLAKRAVSGAAWGIGANVGSRVLGLVSMMLLVSKFGEPSLLAEYGTVTAAVAVIAIINQVLMINLGNYITSNPTSSDKVIFHAHAIHVATGLLALGISVTLGDLLGPFFGAPHVGRYVPGLALAAFIDRFTYTPDRLLLIDLKFRTSVLARTAGEVTFAAVSVAIAFSGLGPIAIVWANIARSIIKTLMVHRAAPIGRCYRPHRFDGAIVKQLSAFGATVNAGAMATYAAGKIDNLLVSRYFGTEVLAYYNLAYNLSEVPSQVVGEQISDVLSVTYAQMGHEERERSLVKSLHIVALLVFPLAIGLAAVSPTLIASFLQPQFATAGIMMMVLATMSLVKPMVGAAFAYLVTQGRQASFATLQGFHLLLLIGLVVVVQGVLHLGWLAVCVAVSASYAVMAIGGMWLVAASAGIGLWSLVSQLLRPGLACAPMVAAVMGVSHLFGQLGLSPRLSLVAEILTGALVYVPSALIIDRENTRDLVQMARNTIARKRAAAAARAAS